MYFDIENELLKLTHDLTIEDWRKMRNNEYWEIHDIFLTSALTKDFQQKMINIKRFKEFILKRVSTYLKSK